MAHKDLMDTFEALSLSEPGYLLFEPSGEMAWIREKFSDIPRYLFRISTSRSDGFNDEIWVKSKAARYARENGNIDIFAIGDKKQTATALNSYLRWEGTDADNMVSWTSSLLLALQYIFYRHKHYRDGSSLAAIKLCIVDTSTLPEGVFLRDMVLIDAYRTFNADLQDLRALRTRKHKEFAGSYYFGEYLSQGALRIEGNCQIVSAQAIIDEGLFLLRPEFQRSMEDRKNEKPQWANEVIRLREAFYYKTADEQQITNMELQAATSIARLFGPRWRLPMAANLIALQPRQRGDGAILRTLEALPFTGLLLLSSSPNIIDSLRRRESGVLAVRDEDSIASATSYIESAELELRTAIIYAHDSITGTKRPKLVLSRAPSVLDTGMEALLRRLDTITHLSQIIEEQIRPIHSLSTNVL